jgi:hypothetical protein
VEATVCGMWITSSNKEGTFYQEDQDIADWEEKGVFGGSPASSLLSRMRDAET